MLRKFLFFIVLFFVMTCRGEAFSANRTALVIGNASYDKAPLANPVNDARDVAEILEDLGFDVILRVDADRLEILRSIDEFGRKLTDKGEIGLFYFAGHGMQIDGENYLIPVKAHVTSEADVEFAGVNAGRPLKKMAEAGNKLNIVILDACRDNPFRRSFRTGRSGLAQMDAPKGTIIAYSTSPGLKASDGKGRNSVYTGLLLKNLKTPGYTINDVFLRTGLGVMKETNDSQVPWVSFTPIPRYCLAGEVGDKARLAVSCNVNGALVMLDGRKVGVTPLSGMLVESGRHGITVKSAGFESYQASLELVPWGENPLHVFLKEIPRNGRLYVDTVPENARVRILNIVPRYTRGMELKPGEYDVEVSSDGAKAGVFKVSLDRDEEKKIKVSLCPLCGGKGKVGEKHRHKAQCRTCNGDGKVFWIRNGRSRVSFTVRTEVTPSTIGAGVWSSQEINGRGELDDNYGKACTWEKENGNTRIVLEPGKMVAFPDRINGDWYGIGIAEFGFEDCPDYSCEGKEADKDGYIYETIQETCTKCKGDGWLLN